MAASFMLYRDTNRKVKKLVLDEIERQWNGPVHITRGGFGCIADELLYLLKDGRWVLWVPNEAGAQSPENANAVTPEEALVWLTKFGQDVPDWLVAEVTTDSEPVPTKSKARRGPRPKFSPAQDKKLIENWQSARSVGGLTQKEFCQQLGKPTKCVKQAQARERGRRLRKNRSDP